LSIGARQLSPGRREAGLLGQTLIKKDRELMSFDRTDRRALLAGPPAQAPL
jgi:hypothetical protein